MITVVNDEETRMLEIDLFSICNPGLVLFLQETITKGLDLKFDNS